MRCIKESSKSNYLVPSSWRDNCKNNIVIGMECNCSWEFGLVQPACRTDNLGAICEKMSGKVGASMSCNPKGLQDLYTDNLPLPFTVILYSGICNYRLTSKYSKENREFLLRFSKQDFQCAYVHPPCNNSLSSHKQHYSLYPYSLPLWRCHSRRG
jgi:hypothetical protein